jgi:hypothetical protein
MALSPDSAVMKQIATLQAMKQMNFVNTPEYEKRGLQLRNNFFGPLQSDGRSNKQGKRCAKDLQEVSSDSEEEEQSDDQSLDQASTGMLPSTLPTFTLVFREERQEEEREEDWTHAKGLGGREDDRLMPHARLHPQRLWRLETSQGSIRVHEQVW